MGNKKAKEREKKKARERMNKIIIGIVSAVVLVAVVTIVGIRYKNNVEGKGYANNNVNEIEKNGEIKTGSNGISNENDLGIELSNYVVAGSEEARRSEEILKKAQEEREKEEKEEIEKSKSTKYAGKSTVQLASNAGNTRDIRGAVQEVAEKDITGGTLTLSKSSYEYSGQRNTPDPTLIVDGDTLILGKDYTIEYTNNVNAGTGTATAKGINGYTGTKTADFTITPKSIAVEWEGGDQFAYDGQEHIPTVKSPMDGVNGDKIYLKVTIKDGKQAIDAGTYTAVAEIESITPGTEPAAPGDITVSHTITNKGNGTTIGDSKVQKGTTLCIQITASQANGTIKSIYSDKDLKSITTTTYNLEITDNGTYGFAIVGSENISKWYTVTVDNYAKVVPIGEIEIGDYVQYTPDTGESATWRVWDIQESNVIITPVNGIGSLTLSSGATDWLNAETKIEAECDKYINASLGITAEEIRSMKIGDIEEVIPADEVEQAKQSYDYGKEYTYTSGTFYAKKADVDTFDGYNKELNTPSIASSSNKVTVVNTYWVDSNPTWNKLNNTKEGMTSDTYGTILGTKNGWLVGRNIGCDTDTIDLCVNYMRSDRVSAFVLYRSNDTVFNNIIGVRPLVTLNSTLFKTGEGTSNNPWQLAK